MAKNEKPRKAYKKKVMPFILPQWKIDILKESVVKGSTYAHVTVPTGRIDASQVQLMVDLVNCYTTALLARKDLDTASLLNYMINEYEERRDAFLDWAERGHHEGRWSNHPGDIRAIRELFTDLQDFFDELLSTERGARVMYKALLTNRTMAQPNAERSHYTGGQVLQVYESIR